MNIQHPENGIGITLLSTRSITGVSFDINFLLATSTNPLAWA